MIYITSVDAFSIKILSQISRSLPMLIQITMYTISVVQKQLSIIKINFKTSARTIVGKTNSNKMFYR